MAGLSVRAATRRRTGAPAAARPPGDPDSSELWSQKAPFHPQSTTARHAVESSQINNVFSEVGMCLCLPELIHLAYLHF